MFLFSVKTLKTATILLALSVAFFGYALPSHAEENENALNDVKESVTNLINAKDQNDSNSLAFRIVTYKKVIDLSISEVKDVKDKLLTVETNEPTSSEISIWKNNLVEKLNTILAYYEAEKEKTNLRPIENLQEIKDVAEEFKRWREENHLSITRDASAFILIKEEQLVIATAEERWEKINTDIEKIKKLNTSENVQNLLEKAKNLINESKEANLKAEEKFLKEVVGIKDEEVLTSEENTSSTENFASTTENSVLDVENSITSSTTQTLPEPSIKDLIKTSLTKVREAYQVFIEMSDFVRKLL